MYFLREFVGAGGLEDYGPDIVDGACIEKAGVYAGQILNGASPALLPVWRPTRFLLFLNLKAAKMLLAVPPSLPWPLTKVIRICLSEIAHV